MEKERVILGENCIYPSDSGVTGLNRNVLVVGGAGTGKTVSFVEPALLESLRVEKPSNKIVVLTKRRLAKKYIPLFKEAGFTVYDLNFVNPEEGNCAYDPLAYVKSEESMSDAARSIVMANERKEHSNADPFWDDGSEDLMTAEMGAAFIKKGAKATFDDAIRIHSGLNIREAGCGITTSLDDFFDSVARADPENYALSSWKTFKEAAPKTAKSIFVSMNPTIKAFTPQIRKCMRTKPGVDFNKFVREKSILFITTSPVNKSLHSLANIFMAQSISELFEIADNTPSGVLPIPTDIIFDDFATGAKIAEMPEKLSICREKGIAFSGILLQSESQLKKMYGEYGATEIIDNCDSYVFMGGNNFDTAKAISLKMNVPLEEVLYLPVGKVIVFRRGQFPVISTRFDVFSDELYQKVTHEYEEKINQPYSR